MVAVGIEIPFKINFILHLKNIPYFMVRNIRGVALGERAKIVDA